MLELEMANTGKVLVIGHRGAMGYAPENTLSSFRKAVELGADLIEFDIHLSADGHIIVIHDCSVERTTDGLGDVSAMTLNEIRNLDAGSHFGPEFQGEKIPTLEEVLRWSGGRIPLVIEIKGEPEPEPGIEEKLIEVLHSYRMLEQSMVISFFHPSVGRIKEIEPKAHTGILFSSGLIDAVGAAREVHADSVRPSWTYWNRDLVRKVHEAGLAASVWTVNDEDIMRSMINMGIDSIATNYPDKLRSLLDGPTRIGASS